MSDWAIRVENLGKRYVIGAKQDNYQTLRDSLAELMGRPLRALRRRSRQGKQDDQDNSIWALRDITFDVQQGDVVGIIGHNGAGKSTLLKILSRITEPTVGHADIRGRVASLLEVGTGFHPELTGRENIFLNSAILGMSRATILRKFDEIVSFSEVEKFIDTPVKRYSSGMYLRLAFGVAAHLEPEILLVDEVLAVGDVAFQKKCMGKMGDVARQGRTVLFVSHNLAAIESLCRRSIILDAGQIEYLGDTSIAIGKYTHRVMGDASSDVSQRKDRRGSGVLQFQSIKMIGEDVGEGLSSVATGMPVSIRLRLKLDPAEALPTENIDVSVTIKDSRGQRVTTLSNFFTGQCVQPQIEGGQWTLSCNIERLPLLEGEYTVDLWCARNNDLYDLVLDAFAFRVNPGSFVRVDDARKPVAYKHGSVYVEQQWMPFAASESNGKTRPFAAATVHGEAQ